MLIKLLASQSNDNQLFEMVNNLDIKSYKKSELVDLYFALTKLKPNFRTKSEAYESIKRNLRAVQRGRAFAKYDGMSVDETSIVRKLNEYCKTSV